MFYHYIEGQTPLDEDEKKDLIPSLATKGDLDVWEQENILEARKWIMHKSILSKSDIFSEAFIRKLHKKMFSHTWGWAGDFRKTDKNIGVPWYEIPVYLHQLIGDTHFWQAHGTYDINTLAVVFHHRLVKIHLFANGNGRHARLIADCIVLKYKSTPLSWGKGHLSSDNALRKAYIQSLRAADAGDYAPLIEFSQS